jgi:hypothetical protein
MVLLARLMTMIAKPPVPGGARAIVADSPLRKHHQSLPLTAHFAYNVYPVITLTGAASWFQIVIVKL